MNEAAPPREPQFSCGLMVTVALLIAALLIAFLFWRLETWPMRTAQQSTAQLEQLGRKMRDAFVDLAQLQPRVTINNRVYLERTTAVAELALVSRRIEVEHEFLHTWAGSTKRVKLHGTFEVKAGFDLRGNVSVDVRDDGIAVQMPHATLLSVEQREVEVLELENGLWNRISASELESELGALPKLARTKAEQAGLAAEAEAALQKELTERIGSERPLRLQFHPEPAAPQ